ncbi:MAG: DUF1761 domain-containing protein [Pseudomonadota bacterium]
MDLIAVLVAGAAGFGFGAVWYGVLGARWRTETGLSEDDVKPANSVPAFVIGVVANMVFAGMARHIFASSGVAGIAAGALSGLGLGLFVAGAFLAVNYAFAKRSLTLALIDIGHAAGVGATVGAVLTAMS